MDQNRHPIRVFVVDDHPVVRHGITSLLSGHSDLEVVGEAENGAEVIPFLDSHNIDVLLLDIKMDGLNGIDVARRVRNSHPSVKVIILTTYDDDNYIQDAFEAGVHGFLLKSVSHESLPDSIRAVMGGESLISPSLISNLLLDYQEISREKAIRDTGLDLNDLKILSVIAKGSSNKEIAAQLYWSEATVKRKVQDILEKLGATNRAQAIAEAIRRGWIM
jgi:DNA-binding NarL/FixJ family response regulator